MAEAGHPFLVNEEGVDTQDEDPPNMIFRAGYLAAMALKLEAGEDRKMLQRSARSLMYAARKLTPARREDGG